MSEKAQIDRRLARLDGKQLLVLGGLGFLGRWVIDVASQYGAVVTVLNRSEASDCQGANMIIQGDIRFTDELDSLVENSDAVIHLAGSLGTESTFSDLPSTVENNVTTTARVIECCLRFKRRAVYPTVGNNWLNPYTITKRCAAKLGFMANEESGGDFRVLKIMNAYGPWQRHDHSRKIIPTFFRCCVLGEPIEVYADGNQCIDLIFARDVAVAFLLAAVEDDLPRDDYIEVGTGIPQRVKEVAELTKKVAGSTVPVKILYRKRKGEPWPSVTLAEDLTLQEKTGFVPEVSLEEGLSQTFEWYLENMRYLDPDSVSTVKSLRKRSRQRDLPPRRQVKVV